MDMLEYRKEYNLTQQELGVELGIARETVTRLESINRDGGSKRTRWYSKLLGLKHAVRSIRR